MLFDYRNNLLQKLFERRTKQRSIDQVPSSFFLYIYFKIILNSQNKFKLINFNNIFNFRAQ